VRSESSPQDFDAYGSELLQRIAGTVAIMLYEMKIWPDGTLECLTFVGLEALIGPVPGGMTPDEAYDAAVHPDDREAYDATGAALARGESVEIEYRLLGHDGQTRWVLDRMRPEGTAEDGSLLVDGVVADITARKRVEEEAIEKLAHAALRDSLTGLANRTAFLEHLDAALIRAERTDKGAAVLFIDLDNFKLVNDSFGHSAGDELLKAVGSRLRTAIRQTDVVARQGGDEFLILLSDLEHSPTEETAFMGAAEVVANTLRRSLRAPFLVEGIEIYISASVGISLFPSDAADSTTLLKHADVAMYTVKEAGRDGHALYRQGTDTALEQISMASRLRKTVEGGDGLVLHYQPLVDLEAGTIVGVEALVRWQRGPHTAVPPGKFVPLAEEVGLIVPIGDWVLNAACAQVRAWQDAGLANLRMAVNLSARQLIRPQLPGSVARALETYRLDPGRLELEITESLLMQHTRDTMDLLEELNEIGVRLVLDDFGTGYSSLSYLKCLPVHALKVDQSFVRGVTTNAHDAAIATAIIVLAHNLGLTVVAEGVETREQMEFLCDRGCDELQGFLFGTPFAPEDAVRALTTYSLV